MVAGGNAVWMRGLDGGGWRECDVEEGVVGNAVRIALSRHNVLLCPMFFSVGTVDWQVYIFAT